MHLRLITSLVCAIFALGHATMAYGGKVDWRYQPGPVEAPRH
jgi:hypothetical protein